MSEIIKGKLFLGDFWKANDIDFLKTKNINVIICVAKDIVFKPEILDNMIIHKYQIEDTLEYDISVHLDEITDLIHDYIMKGNNVLVNCMAGISRSATITIAYLMKYENMILKEALQFVKEKRYIICPNRNFLFKLSDYECKIYYAKKTTFQEALKILCTKQPSQL
jgi:protein-tyrosine phosphatase